MFAIKSDGSLWSWDTWQFFTEGSEPTRIGTDYDWVNVSAGVLHTLAARNNNSLWAWGANTTGQIGIGPTGFGAVADEPTLIISETASSEDFVPVRSIIIFGPAVFFSDSYFDLNYFSYVFPSHATNQQIEWTILDDGGMELVVNNGILTTESESDFWNQNTVIKAVIADGASETTDFTQEFTVTVTITSPETPSTYYLGDIEVINELIANNGLNMTPLDTTRPIHVLPSRWSGIRWSSSEYQPRRIVELSFGNRNLTGDLDLSCLTYLRRLEIHQNSVTSLTLSDMPHLEMIRAYFNDIWHLELSNLPSLVFADLAANVIILPLLYNLPQLEVIDLSYNWILHLDISVFPRLWRLWVDDNNLITLDISANPYLEILDVRMNQMSSQSDIIGLYDPWSIWLRFEPQRYIRIQPIPDGLVGVAGREFSHQMQATVYATWSAFLGELPPGLVLDSGGLIHGMPAQEGDFFLIVEAVSAGGTSSIALLYFNIAGPSGPGDINGDGRITATDVMLLRMYLAGHPIAVDLSVGDVSGDGVITDLDVLLLRLQLAGHQVDFSSQAASDIVPHTIAYNAELNAFGGFSADVILSGICLRDVGLLSRS